MSLFHSDPFVSEWEESSTPPFDEAILTWNGVRPPLGKWTFWVSLQQSKTWSSWIQYAEWGSSHQKTFHSQSAGVKSYQDGVHPQSGFADGFRVRVTPGEGADLKGLFSMSCSLSSQKKGLVTLPASPLSPVLITERPGRSQIALQHPLSQRICSPTSVVNVVKILTQERLDPIDFAGKVYDSSFDIYGNWILNVAAAYDVMKGAGRCYVERLSSFETLHASLMRKKPVIVSVRGPLEGAPQPYSQGHLLTVVGYKDEKVICIDPGFASDEETLHSYPLADFISAWNRRQNVAYIFE